MEIPDLVADDEVLHRRVHPTFVKPDGLVSSQAFRDREMSVDRASYSNAMVTIRGCAGFGVTAILTSFARSLNQEVLANKQLLHPAHALVIGNKSKAIARRFASETSWVIRVFPTPNDG